MRLTKTATARATAVLGLLVFGYGILEDGKIDRTDIRAVGLACATASLMWFFVSRGRHAEQRAYQAGYDVGYLDGRRVARPVVIPQDRHLGVVANDR